MASGPSDDDTVRKLRHHLQDFDKQQQAQNRSPPLASPSSSQQASGTSQQSPQHQQHPAPPVPHSQAPSGLGSIQRTHAGFQSTAGTDQQHQHHTSASSPHPHSLPPPHHHHQLPPLVDPQLGGGAVHHLAPIQGSPGAQQAMPSMIHDDDAHMSQDGERKGRQLSTTKRAAQNRAAQRAFRLRKEVHIKNLESKVQEIEPLKSQIVELQRDNYTLRGYLITMLEMIAKKGLEPPPGVPKMQHMDADPSVFSNTIASGVANQQQHQQSQRDGEDSHVQHDLSRPSDMQQGPPTAPMQDIAQQASQAIDGGRNAVQSI